MNRTLAKFVPILAALFLVIGVVLCLLKIAVAFSRARPAEGASLEFYLQDIGPGLMYLIAGGGGACLLLALVELMERPMPMPPELGESMEGLNKAVHALQTQMRRSAQAPAVAEAAPAPGIDPKLAQRAVELLEEMRELSLMNEEQKQARLQQNQQQRMQNTLRNVHRLIDQKHWATAAQYLQPLEKQFPGSADLAKARGALERGRSVAQGEAFARLRAQTEEYMSISSWDEALQGVQKFLEDFPQHSEAESLLARVSRERDLFRESTIQRLYDETKNEIEHRKWRRALAAAQRLTGRFPDDSRTGRIRGQFMVIQENAEIEERQETESRIQELVRGRRYPEAITLAEELLQRFPLSPQAEELEELLPRLRERALRQEMESDRV